MFDENDIVRSHKKRLDVIGGIVIVSFALILSRLWFLQIYKGDDLFMYSLENRLRKENISAPRGMIYSRNNELLVHNVPRFDVVVTPQYLGNRKLTLEKLSSILDISYEQIEKILEKNSRQAKYRPVTVKKNVTRREVAIIETENAKVPGVGVVEFISREYKDKEVGAHLFGYISEISQNQLSQLRKRDNFEYKFGDFIGQGGIEEKMDLELRGVDGYRFMEVDALGRLKQRIEGESIFQEVQNKEVQTGNNIRLTIDRDLQLTAYKALEDKVGSAVVVDVHTGEILAMVSRPSFNPTQFSRGLTTEYWGSLVNDEKNPLRDRTIQEHYSPGSTFKTITAITALEEGIIDTNTTVNCKGYFQLGRRKFHCWKQFGHGKVNLIKSLRESCDVYYYKIATMLDIDVLAKYARSLGFGMKSGINLSRETSGLIPTKEWKKTRNGEEWVKGETLSCVIGQSFVLVTPLQLAMGYAAIANGGKLYKPKIIKEVFLNSGEILNKSETELVNEANLKKETLALIKKGLWESVNTRKGTAWWQRGQGIDMAGKTGTSQVISLSADKLFTKCEEKKYKHRHHGVFSAFAPAEDPKIAIGVVVEHGCHGGSAAAPVARDIAQVYMKKYYPEDYETYLARDRRLYRKYLQQAKG